MREYFDVQRSSTYPDLDVFSDSDIEVLKETVETYGKKTAWQLRDLIHDFPEIGAALARSAACASRSLSPLIA